MNKALIEMDKEIENSVTEVRQPGSIRTVNDLKNKEKWSELKLLWTGREKMDLRNADNIEEVIKVNKISTESCSTMVLIDR